MVVAPIIPNLQDMDGKIVTFWFEYTSAAAVNTITLPTYAPQIDLDAGCPIISLASILTEAITDISESKAFTPAKECARAAAPDAAEDEWAIQTANTLKVDTSDKNGIMMITYIAKGGQKA